MHLEIKPTEILKYVYIVGQRYHQSTSHYLEPEKELIEQPTY